MRTVFKSIFQQKPLKRRHFKAKKKKEQEVAKTDFNSLRQFEHLFDCLNVFFDFNTIALDDESKNNNNKIENHLVERQNVNCTFYSLNE